MSARRTAIQLAPQAERDFENILLYTQHTWGHDQSAIYQAAIAQALSALSDHPRIGRSLDDLFTGCRSVQVEQHVIYIRQRRAGEIEVLRILHYHQDASATMPAPRS